MTEKCAMCDGPLNPYDKQTWKEVVGWVGGPRKDSMKDRKNTGRYAHNHCILKVTSGQAIDQPEMFDDDGTPDLTKLPPMLADRDDCIHCQTDMLECFKGHTVCCRRCEHPRKPAVESLETEGPSIEELLNESGD